MGTKRRMTPRDTMLDMLVIWGQWEAEGRWQQGVCKSSLGALIKNGPAAPNGNQGSRIPIGVMPPREVTIIDRLLAYMREHCRAGYRYAAALRTRYVLDEPIDAVLVSRAVSWLVQAWAAICRSNHVVAKNLQTENRQGIVAQNANAPSGQTTVDGVFYAPLPQTLNWQPLRLKMAQGS